MTNSNKPLSTDEIVDQAVSDILDVVAMGKTVQVTEDLAIEMGAFEEVGIDEKYVDDAKFDNLSGAF
jgi:hypothetical protein